MASPSHRLDPADSATTTAPTPSGRFDLRRWPIAIPTLLATLAVAVVAISGVRGSDYPAHYFRAAEWSANPFGTWNFQWYGGHSTFAYSVLSPPLAVLLSPFGACAITSIASVALAGLVARRFVGRAATLAATFTVALVAIDSVIVGRVPYALGYLLMLATLLLWSHRHTGWAAVVAATVGLASPVAAVMLGLIVLPIAIDRMMSEPGSVLTRLRAAGDALTVGGATAVPLVVMSVVTARSESATGYFPFIAINIAFSVASAAAILLTARRRVVRLGAAIALVVTVLAATIPNPLGGNLGRYAGFVLVPLATALAVERFDRQRQPTREARRDRSPGVLVTGVLWLAAVGFAVSFSARTTYRWYHDPSHRSGYFEPLLAEIERWHADHPLTRVEIPFTQGHMEAAVVAAAVPYARGWERQVDLDRNAVLYDQQLTSDAYRDWLDSMGVGLIAVSDAPLDAGGKPEVALIDEGLDWLEPVWEGEHWRLYAIERPASLATAAEVTTIDANGITFDAPAAGDITIAAVFDPRLAISPAGCLHADEAGNIVASIDRPGEYHIGERRFAFLSGGVAPCPG